MKLSIAWIFDHIEADWHTVDIDQLITLFNHKTAEIESVEKIVLDQATMVLAQVTAIDDTGVILVCAHLTTSLHLPVRKNVYLHEWYILKQSDAGHYRWATLADLGGQKEGLLPAIHVNDNNYQQAWDKLEYEDYIVHVDNKSVTHRPDLWGHRGFAQEIALLLDLPLKPLDNFLYACDVRSYEKKIEYSTDSGCAVAINTDKCQRFASLYIPYVTYMPSLLWMAGRLSRIDSRPIDLLVDCTNYVMQDIGQPMHAFDAATLTDKNIIVRQAYAQEKLWTLDNDTLELVPDDIVIANSSTALSLAGVMGGYSSAVSKSTHSLLIESASFAPTPIRLSALRHKKRTEASTRFEKGLDPNQNIIALERFVHLLQEAQVRFETSGIIFSLGKTTTPKTIELSHTLLEEALGVALSVSFVQELFKKLQFGVIYNSSTTTYTVTIPTGRSSKDITIPEDLIEEVGRFYGYSNIAPSMPAIATQPADLTPFKRLRLIKQFFAGTAAMHELHNYAFFDESFLPLINWQPTNAVSVQQPVSHNWSRLVTTLIPGLFKAVYDNVADNGLLRFFEVGQIWHGDGKNINEQSQGAGIFFDQDSKDTFYTVQAYLQDLMSKIGISVTWQQIKKPTYPWFTPYQTAGIMHKGIPIGTLGLVDQLFLKQLTKVGAAILFDIDINYLLHLAIPDVQAMPLSKFPSVSRDISLLVPLTLPVEEVKRIVGTIDKRITHIDLIDCFTKDAWPDQRALTLRFIISDPQKTFTKIEVDEMVALIAKQLALHKVVMR